MLVMDRDHKQSQSHKTEPISSQTQIKQTVLDPQTCITMTGKYVNLNISMILSNASICCTKYDYISFYYKTAFIKNHNSEKFELQKKRNT